MTEPLPSLRDPTIQVCPFPAYARLRTESPVYYDPASGMYEVTRIDLVKIILADTVRFSNKTGLIGNQGTEAGQKAARLYRQEGFPLVNTPIDSDPPEHRKMRSLVDTTLSIAKVRALEPKIAQIANGFIDKIASAGHAEFMTEVAVMYPITVIVELLGVASDQITQIKRWSDALLAVCESGLAEEPLLKATREVIEMQQFLAREIAAAREELAAGRPRQGIVSGLVQQTMDGQPLDTGWIVNMLQNLLVGGNETTTAALGSAMLYLARDAHLQNRLRGAPESIPAFIEEVLRLESPLQNLWRKTTQDIELAGVRIPKDAIVSIRYGAANRDEREYPNPDQLDMARSAITQHLTFGRGVHYCIGNILARAELKIAVGLALDRLVNIRLDGDNALVREPHHIAYGPKALHIRFDLALTRSNRGGLRSL
jgi:cytochrome P450